MDKQRPPLKSGDVYPAHVLRDEYGFNAENRPVIQVVESEVPEELRVLIPYAERWAISCDVTRGDYFDKQDEKEIAEFYYSVQPHVEKANEWLDSLGKDVLKWPEAGVHFMYMLKAHGEAYQPTPEEIEEREARFAEHRARMARKKAIEEAMNRFKEKNFERVVELLSPYQGDLSKVEETKLKYALKQIKK